MSIIQFDVLAPDTAAPRIRDSFSRACTKLVERALVTRADLSFEESPAVSEEVVEQLAHNYREEHEGQDLDNASMWRVRIEVEGRDLSLNSLAMGFSKLLTPSSELPKDPVALERAADFEAPTPYPWMVEVRR